MTTASPRVRAAASALYEYDCRRSGIPVNTHTWEKVKKEYERQAEIAVSAADKS